MQPGVSSLNLATAVAVALYYVLPFDRNGVDTGANPAQIAMAIIIFLALAGLTGRAIHAQMTGSGRQVRLQGLVFLVVLVVLFFAVLYLGMAGQFAGLDTKTDALYFTVSTLGTVGFGDVHATGQGARVAVTIQMVFDLVFVASLASVITGIIRERTAAARRGHGADPGRAGAGPTAGA